MDFAVIIENLPLYLQGLVVTIELLVISIIAGLVLAVPIGVAAASDNRWVNALPRGSSISCAARR